MVWLWSPSFGCLGFGVSALCTPEITRETATPTSAWPTAAQVTPAPIAAAATRSSCRGHQPILQALAAIDSGRKATPRRSAATSWAPTETARLSIRPRR